MNKPTPSNPPDTSALDEVLIDVAVLIEVSPSDRRIIENRYRQLKDHVERPSSAIREYLVDGESHIYAQGSIATSTTVLSGDDDDRFDLDAIVEMDVPEHWSDNQALDELYETLQGFPNAREIVRCTRCVQIRFAFMHMDVTVMDRRHRIDGDRPGHIFHSPDEGRAYRVDSNPWGFTSWFRGEVGVGQALFEKRMNSVRDFANVSHIQFDDLVEKMIACDAEQVPLPPAIPSRVDTQQVVALKLLKRYLNLRYAESELKKPPSIWVTKLTGDLGLSNGGLTQQLYALTTYISSDLRYHLKNGSKPREENPSYPKDRINDRWPQTDQDMQVLADHLDYFADALQQMNSEPQDQILKKIEELFGERSGTEVRAILKKRYDRRAGGGPLAVTSAAGTLSAPAVITSPSSRPVPEHRFHSGFVEKGKSHG